MSTWYCDTDHEAVQFNDFESFTKHMKDSATHPGRLPPSDLQLDTLSRTRQKILTRNEEYSCPFCDCIPDTLKPVIPTSEPKEILHELHKHIAIHIKDLAVLSVPVLIVTETPEGVTVKSEDEVKRRRLGKGEKSSYPSGYDEELRAVPLSEDENPEERPPLDVQETQTAHWSEIEFIEWYEKEGAGAKISDPETDVVLQEFIRARALQAFIRAQARARATATVRFRTVPPPEQKKFFKEGRVCLLPKIFDAYLPPKGYSMPLVGASRREFRCG
jgi:hypothetical protein